MKDLLDPDDIGCRMAQWRLNMYIHRKGDPLTVLLELLKMEDVSLKMFIGFLSYWWRHLSWRVESNFHVLLPPYGGVLQGAENPFSEKHSILTTFLEKQQLAASENC
ncbi:hypothetical protein SO802_005251 [Lithocarpus litseifolius]|uniref:Uncharacterized protein n=1 Tax=Lithocarpus litseifolius TaxID=425828 RepID=A0AAW2DHN7_9ROSI